jgi:hypothetical protein
LDANWREILEDVSLRAIPIKYIASVELELKNQDTCSIDVASKLRDDWSGNLETASVELEKLIGDVHELHGVSMVEYLLDFDMIRSEVSFTSAKLGNDNNSNRN